MPSSSRIISADELGDVAPWSFGRLTPGKPHGAASVSRSQTDGATGAQTEEERTGFETGFRDGYQKGYQEGMRAFQAHSQAEAQALSARLDGLAQDFRERLHGLEQALADEVIELAIEIARQTVRTTLAVRRDAVRPVVEEALASLIDERARAIVHVNPEDEAMLREALGALLDERGMRLVADPTITAGGCRVDSAHASVDGSVQTRWRRALEALGRSAEWVE